jgi:flagellar biosynthesis regulator FlbT
VECWSWNWYHRALSHKKLDAVVQASQHSRPLRAIRHRYRREDSLLNTISKIKNTKQRNQSKLRTSTASTAS